MGIKIRPVFAWYDFWIGIFIDRKARKLYILPLPCIGIVISFTLKEEAERPQAVEKVYDEDGELIHMNSYCFGRLFSPGQKQIINFKEYETISCKLVDNEVTTIVRGV